MSCLTLAGRVTLAGVTTFSHVNKCSPNQDNLHLVGCHVIPRYYVSKDNHALEYSLQRAILNDRAG